MKTALLLVNLGSPEAPNARAVARFLRRFLADPRVVDRPRWWWLPLLYGVIAPLRAPRSAKLYRAIWQPEGSPLTLSTMRLAQALHEALQWPVAAGMCYGRPSIEEALDRLWASSPEQLCVLALYPQYSSTTTAAAFDAVARALARRIALPALHFVRDYADDEGYLDLLAARVRAFWRKHGRPEMLVVSFHGIPERLAEKGDPYPERCAVTFEGLRRRLGSEVPLRMAYQSRFGREPWLKPYLDALLLEIAAEGVRCVDLICPGFAVDGLETLEEIAGQMRALFATKGGKLRYIPALNDKKDHAAMLAAMLRRKLGGR